MTVQTTPPPSPIVVAGAVRFGNDLPLALIAGPCMLESRGHALDVAGALKEIAARLGIGLVYKTSYDKANRTSAASARGVGLEGALPVFEEIRAKFGLPVLTDVHESSQCAEVATVTGAGNANVLVTERGASFGYNTLISDMRALPILARSTGAPVIFDAT